MKKFSTMLVLGALISSACADDISEGSLKAEVDRAALEDGLTVSLVAEIGSVTVPFVTPVPSASDAELQVALAESVSLVVRNDASGATANLMSGALVNSTPSTAGQYAVALNESRDAVTVTFYNATTAGQSLHAGGAYTATLSIASNDYVENLGTTAVSVGVN